MYKEKISIIFMGLLLTSCAELSQREDLLFAKQRIQALEEKVKEQEQKIQDLRDQKLYHPRKVKPMVYAAPTPTSPPLFQWTTEKKVYHEIAQSYLHKRAQEMQIRVHLLLRNAPKSAYADNALFLLGDLLYEKGKYQEALEVFDRLIGEYPYGNKVVGALLLKAMLYRSIGLDPKAYDLLKKIHKSFPGSPESLRAVNELKTLRVKKS